MEDVVCMVADYRTMYPRRTGAFPAFALETWTYSAEALVERKRVRELLTQSRELSVRYSSGR
jgi:hypothetical protein